MKIFIFCRHSLKKGEIIGQEGLDMLEGHELVLKDDDCLFPTYLYNYVFYGEYYRTCQTALALVANLDYKVRVMEPISNLSSNKFFEQFYQPGNDAWKKELENGTPSTEAFDKVYGKIQTTEWGMFFAEGVKIAFSKMEKDTVGIGFGHDPWISYAARYFGKNNIRALKELEYEIFIQEDDGRIWVANRPYIHAIQFGRLTYLDR
ncbi:MAG: hypothetical protein MUF50_01170 [Planctomycetes bacterium]|jgi:hypothetical protein|nr:hypothetical protein [Planctomycetota bacterium]